MSKIIFRLSHSLSGEKSYKTVKAVFAPLVCGFIICFAISMVSFDAQSKELSAEIFRLHILANSDSEEDQNLKLDVRDLVQEYCSGIYGDADTKEEAEEIIAENLGDIIELAQDEIYRQGYDYTVSGEIVNTYFTNRVYGDITLPAGDYDALQITIGEGEGHNWWCVMFPPICINSAEAQSELSDVLTDGQTELVTENSYQYKFKIYELYQNIMEKLDKE